MICSRSSFSKQGRIVKKQRFFFFYVVLDSLQIPIQCYMPHLSSDWYLFDSIIILHKAYQLSVLHLFVEFLKIVMENKISKKSYK